MHNIARHIYNLLTASTTNTKHIQRDRDNFRIFPAKIKPPKPNNIFSPFVHNQVRHIYITYKVYIS